MIEVLLTTCMLFETRLSCGTVFVDLVTLTLKFDLLSKKFIHCFYFVMVAAQRASLSSENSNYMFPLKFGFAFFSVQPADLANNKRVHNTVK